MYLNVPDFHCWAQVWDLKTDSYHGNFFYLLSFLWIHSACLYHSLARTTFMVTQSSKVPLIWSPLGNYVWSPYVDFVISQLTWCGTRSRFYRIVQSVCILCGRIMCLYTVSSNFAFMSFSCQGAHRADESHAVAIRGATCCQVAARHCAARWGRSEN